MNPNPWPTSQFLQQGSYGFRGGAVATGTFDAPALHDENHAPSFLRGPDRLAHIGRLKLFLRLNILNRQALPDLPSLLRADEGHARSAQTARKMRPRSGVSEAMCATVSACTAISDFARAIPPPCSAETAPTR